MSSNPYKQSLEWESAYFQTRRDLKKRQERISLFNISQNDFVLDLGCGDGLNISLLKRVGIKKIVGVEPSKQFFNLAKKNNPRVEVYQATAEKLPFKNNTFDVVLVDSVFHHITDYQASLSEISRVLKDGGVLCFLEPRNTFLRWLADTVAPTWIGQNLPVIKTRSKAYMGEREVMTHWLSTYDQFFNLLKKAGFKKIFCENNGESFAGKYKNEKNR